MRCVLERLPVSLWGLLAASFFTACVSAPLDPQYFPRSLKPLPAAGIHLVRFGFEVIDERDLGQSLDLCPNDAPLGRGMLKAARKPGAILKRAMVRAFESHDLKVVNPADADLVVHIELLHFMCWTAGDEVRTLIEGNVAALDAATGRELYWFNKRSKGYWSLGILPGTGPYVWAFEDALEQFAGRVVRRPQILIAAQQIASRVPARDAQTLRPAESH